MAAIAVHKVVRKLGIECSIKWPNDLHYKGKKICGILTEGVFYKKNSVVVGIGLNVNQEKFPKSIKNEATSLKLVKNKLSSKKKNQDLDIDKISKSIIENFFTLYDNYYNKNKLKFILNNWKKNCDTIGKNITIVQRSKKLKGKCVGVDDDCNLLLKLKNKEAITIVEGDVTLKN